MLSEQKSIVRFSNSLHVIGLLLVTAINHVGSASQMSRMIGGSEATIEEFPWQVAVLENNNFTCGAAIISKRHVLTAAHCVSVDSIRISPTAVRLRMGTANLNSNDVQKYGVRSIKIHWKFKEVYPYIHDIAVLKLAKKIKFDKTKRPIALPTKDVPVNVLAKFSGWGMTQSGHFARNLQKLDFQIIDNTDCDESKIDKNHQDFNHPQYEEPLNSGQLCGLPAADSGGCEGDSGGGLVYSKSLVGIFSWKYGCGRGYPNIFTRVYQYVDWIQDQISD